MVNFVEAYRCSRCGDFRHPSSFGKCASSRNGLQYNCRDCSARQRREREDAMASLPAWGEKACPKCDTVKPASEFYPCKANRSKLSSHCKACCRERGMSLHVRFASVEKPAIKKCAKCGETKESAEFYPNRREKDRLSRRCIACSAAGRDALAAKYAERPPTAEKKCSKCGAVKPSSCFSLDRAHPTGLQSKCRDCAKARSKILASRTVIEVPESKTCTRCGIEKSSSSFHRNANCIAGVSQRCKQCHARMVAKKKYSLDDEMMSRYDSATECEVCGKSFSDSLGKVIDHCHATGEVRGFLCNPCNKMLGFARDNPEVMRAAAGYLESFVSQEKE